MVPYQETLRTITEDEMYSTLPKSPFSVQFYCFSLGALQSTPSEIGTVGSPTPNSPTALPNPLFIL